jgi:hypothetical protein
VTSIHTIKALQSREIPMTSEIMKLRDRLEELKPQLDFILRAMGAAAVDETDFGLKLTVDEAYQGVVLGQQLVRELVKLTLQLQEKTMHLDPV